MTRPALLALPLVVSLATGAMAQSAPSTGLADPAWTLEVPAAGTARPPRRKAKAVTPPPSADAERAAHDAELRRRFYDSQSKPDTKKGPTDFGGYDAATMSGSGHPGVGMKF